MSRDISGVSDSRNVDPSGEPRTMLRAQEHVSGIGAAFLAEVHRLHRASRRDEAGGGDGLVTMRLFHLSLVYLTVVFAAVAAGALLR